MVDFVQLVLPLLLLILLSSSIVLLYIKKLLSTKTAKKSQLTQTKLPKSYPIIGHLIVAYQQKDRFQWLTNLLISSPTSTFILHRPFGVESIQTADPTVVEHILKTHFSVYQKGPFQKGVLRDLLGDGIFNADSNTWKFQRQVASYEFNTKSLRKFVENVVESELSNRLLPILSEAARTGTVLDLQNILKRFAFDNICKIAFGYDPEYLSPTLPEAKFALAFEEAVRISTNRFQAFFPILWKVCRLLNVGSERRLKKAVFEIREFAASLVRQKKQEMMNDSEDEALLEAEDLLSRFLKSGHSDEKFVTDIVISFILAGRDTTSAALTWFFWLLHKNKAAEEEILKDIKKRENQRKKEHTTTTTTTSVFEEVKEMVYIHAAVCESMRLYPPVAVDMKEAVANDVLPGGIRVKKGTRVSYHPYAMGRSERLWGPDWAEYRPERWLEVVDGKWRFVPRDSYSYPVFQAGPRMCLGKEMAFLQMKRVVASVLKRFRVIPVVEGGVDPVYVPQLTAKMQGGLPVRIEERIKSLRNQTPN